MTLLLFALVALLLNGFSGMSFPSLISLGILCLLCLLKGREATERQPQKSNWRIGYDAILASVTLMMLMNSTLMGGDRNAALFACILLLPANSALAAKGESWLRIICGGPGWILLLLIIGSSEKYQMYLGIVAFLALCASFAGREFPERMIIAAIGATVNILGGLLLWAAGVPAPYDSVLRVTKQASRGLAIGDFRWRVPIGRAWEDVPFLATILLVAAITIVYRRAIHRVIGVAAFLLASAVILGVNGRTLLLGVFVTLFQALIVRVRERSIPAVVLAGFVASLMPLWWSKVSTGFVNFLGTVATQNEFARSTQAFSSLEGRTYIWDISVGYWQAANTVRQLIGFGANGHIKSGAAYAYASVLSDSTVSSVYRGTYYSTHNAFLMLLLSHGALFLIGLVVVGWVAFRQLLALHDSQAKRPIALLVFSVGVASATSVITLPTGTTSALLLYAVLSSPGSLRSDKSRSETSHQRNSQEGSIKEESTRIKVDR